MQRGSDDYKTGDFFFFFLLATCREAFSLHMYCDGFFRLVRRHGNPSPYFSAGALFHLRH
jgi:hypothetical protein